LANQKTMKKMINGNEKVEGHVWKCWFEVWKDGYDDSNPKFKCVLSIERIIGFKQTFKNVG
jgi:hypothetical protein